MDDLEERLQQEHDKNVKKANSLDRNKESIKFAAIGAVGYAILASAVKLFPDYLPFDLESIGPVKEMSLGEYINFSLPRLATTTFFTSLYGFTSPESEKIISAIIYKSPALFFRAKNYLAKKLGKFNNKH